MLPRPTMLCLAAACTIGPAYAQPQTGSAAAPVPAGQEESPAAEPREADVILEVPELSVEKLDLEFERLDAKLSLEARLANLLTLNAGVNANIEKGNVKVEGLTGDVRYVVYFDDVRAIIERTLQTIDANPRLVDQLNAAAGAPQAQVTGGVESQTKLRRRDEQEQERRPLEEPRRPEPR